MSVILPTYNEMALGFLPKIIAALTSCSDVEIIVVDRNSSDGTSEWLKEQPVQLISTEENSRASRLNIGVSKACGEIILLHHPRSILEPSALQLLVRAKDQLNWGGFTHVFDLPHPLLKFTSWYSNRVRAKRAGIVYLDHCIFVHRRLVTGKPFVPEVDIFEDTELSKKLLKHSRPQILPALSQTSAIRFQKNGIYKQALANQLLKLGYKLNLPHRWMNRQYERRLQLNSTYHKH